MDYIDAKKELYIMHQTYSTLISLARKLDKREKRDFNGLTARQCIAMLAIQNLPEGKASMVGIAKKLGTTKQNVNKMISVLVKKGYVVKAVREDDKRAVDIQVTEPGLTAMLAYTRENAAGMVDIFSGFSESEMEMMLHFTQRLYGYDGDERLDAKNDMMWLFDSDHSDLLDEILEEYKSKR